MKKRIHHIMTVFFLLLAFSSFTVTAKADTAGELTVNENQILLGLNLPEGKTETITSLRLQMYVKIKSGSMEEPTFQFEKQLQSEVKDVEVSQNEQGDYLIDLILSGKQNQDIFHNTEKAVIGILTLNSAKNESFTAEAGIAGENGITGEDADSVVYYVDSSGISMEMLTLTSAEPVEITHIYDGSGSSSEEPLPDTGVQPKPQPEEDIAVGKINKFSVKFQNNTKAVLTWSKVKGADGFEVYRTKKKDGKYTLLKRLKNGNKSRKLVVNYPKGKKYYYKVRAYVKDDSGKKIYGDYTDPKRARLDAPKLKIKKSAVSPKKLVFRWNKILRADGYKLYKYNSRTGNYRRVANIKEGTSWIRKFKTDKPVVFRIRAYERGKDGQKIYGNYSKAVTLR